MPTIRPVQDWRLPNCPIIDYKWERDHEGGDRSIATIRSLILLSLGLAPSVGDALTLGSLRLIVVGIQRAPPFGVLVVRDTGWKSWVWVKWFRAKQFFSKINRRILLTLGVWGLAKHNRAEEPSWKNLLKKKGEQT